MPSTRREFLAQFGAASTTAATVGFRPLEPSHILYGVGTINGAYASFEEDLKGSLEPGKLADLVVLGRDPLREPPESLVTIPVERTMVGGHWVYE